MRSRSTTSIPRPARRRCPERRGMRKALRRSALFFFAAGFGVSHRARLCFACDTSRRDSARRQAHAHFFRVTLLWGHSLGSHSLGSGLAFCLAAWGQVLPLAQAIEGKRRQSLTTNRFHTQDNCGRNLFRGCSHPRGSTIFVTQKARPDPRCLGKRQDLTPSGGPVRGAVQTLRIRWTRTGTADASRPRRHRQARSNLIRRVRAAPGLSRPSMGQDTLIPPPKERLPRQDGQGLVAPAPRHVCGRR